MSRRGRRGGIFVVINKGLSLTDTLSDETSQSVTDFEQGRRMRDDDPIVLTSDALKKSPRDFIRVLNKSNNIFDHPVFMLIF